MVCYVMLCYCAQVRRVCPAPHATTCYCAYSLGCDRFIHSAQLPESFLPHSSLELAVFVDGPPESNKSTERYENSLHTIFIRGVASLTTCFHISSAMCRHQLRRRRAVSGREGVRGRAGPRPPIARNAAAPGHPGRSGG